MCYISAVMGIRKVSNSKPDQHTHSRLLKSCQVPWLSNHEAFSPTMLTTG